MRLTLTPELSALIASRIARYSIEGPEHARDEALLVAASAALPLYRGWTETIGIRADGEMVAWSTESDYSGVRPVQERVWVLLSLVAGSERHPEPRALLPERPADAIDCRCQHHPVVTSGNVLCGECGGIGWLYK
jgi:hypothetical protein